MICSSKCHESVLEIDYCVDYKFLVNTTSCTGHCSTDGYMSEGPREILLTKYQMFSPDTEEGSFPSLPEVGNLL